jgi:glycosyltransferase involved in cell wall biosynthesis
MIKNTDPLISIITIVYNSKSYLEATIKSIIGQTYKNIEYIIIDGGSTDGTLEIIKKYSKQISKWISERDSGIYDAMNKGLATATGEYVLFINSGDEIANPDVLFKIFSSEVNADCYYGNTILINPDGSVLKKMQAPDKLSWKSFFNGMPYVSHQSMLFRRNCIGNYDLKYKLVSDQDWIIRGLKKSTTIQKVGFPISKYLLGGFSDNNFYRCWKERTIITDCYFGKYTHIYSMLLFFIASGKRSIKKLIKRH